MKPGFFQNEYLAELDPQTRLLFIGLWLMADREGRLEDRPKRIKMQVFPADTYDVDPMLNDLQSVNLIRRYIVDGIGYICIPAWHKHQNPHVKEKPSTIPAPDQHSASTGDSGARPADSLIPDSLIPDSKDRSSGDDHFGRWWVKYPQKRKKKTAKEIWKRKKLDRLTDELIADVQNRLANDQRWKEGFVPDPTTYLNQERWEDELESAKPAKSSSYQDQLREWVDAQH